MSRLRCHLLRELIQHLLTGSPRVDPLAEKRVGETHRLIGAKWLHVVAEKPPKNNNNNINKINIYIYIQIYIYICILYKYTYIHYITVQYVAIHCSTLQYIALQYITLHAYVCMPFKSCKFTGSCVNSPLSSPFFAMKKRGFPRACACRKRLKRWFADISASSWIRHSGDTRPGQLR